jgi:16S rRNA C1402 (ribose-2'-O) methylase RsmI
MNAYDLLKEKTKEFIEYLSQIETVKKNEWALTKLSSFQDVGTTVSICKELQKDYENDDYRTLLNLMVGCTMNPTDFNKEQTEKFAYYLRMFMDIVKTYC